MSSSAVFLYDGLALALETGIKCLKGGRGDIDEQDRAELTKQICLASAGSFKPGEQLTAQPLDGTSM